MKIKKYIALGLLSVTLATPLWATAQSSDDLIAQGLIESPLPQGVQSSYAKEYLDAEKALQAGNRQLLDQLKFQVPEILYRAYRHANPSDYSRAKTLQLMQSAELVQKILADVKVETFDALDLVGSLPKLRDAAGLLAQLGYLDALAVWETVQSLFYHQLDRGRSKTHELYPTSSHINEEEEEKNIRYRNLLEQMATVTFKNPTLLQQRFMVQVKSLLATAKQNGYYGFQQDKSPEMKKEVEALREEGYRLRDLQFPPRRLDGVISEEQEIASGRYVARHKFIKQNTLTYVAELFPWDQNPNKALQNFQSFALALYQLSGNGSH